ncbi:MAG TPA: lysine 2,3-aminomutase [Bacteroidia bacterium]|jgi:KamA family protein|nr:lysine 2,3-aminomutase [Bacteroidia bacterium]
MLKIKESPAVFKSYSISQLRRIPQLEKFSHHELLSMEVVGNVLPFKVNTYVTDELIDWDKAPDDPIFRLTFPQEEMLHPLQFSLMEKALRHNQDREHIKDVADSIRELLNPHPAGQMEFNIPEVEGNSLNGLQHKYRETVLFFPSQGQTCHSYCTFCFRWPQFVGMEGMKFAAKETEQLVEYLRRHEEVSDVLFTGGDPLIMRTGALRTYIEPLLNAGLPNLKTIRIGTKALSYWPYRFTSGKDADDLIALFEEIGKKGIHLALMAHFSHPVELSTSVVESAIRRIRETGVQIRTQSPVLRHINDSPEVWAEMWTKQVAMGCIPYYMFMPRDTGAKKYFEVPLVEAWEIFRKAYQQVSGICRTVRGPSMSCTPGKIQMLGVSEIPTETGMKKVMTLRFLQGRDPDWVVRPFFAEYDPNATWIDELRPAFGGNKFFFEK